MCANPLGKPGRGTLDLPAPGIEGADLSPRPVVDSIAIPGGEVAVVRDDLLPGGTKQRAAHPYLRDLVDAGAREFTYASPAPGFAQVAIAHVCAALGVRCTVFAETLGGRLHECSALAASHGAVVQPCSSLDEAEQRAEEHRAQGGGRVKIPLGLGDGAFRGHLERVLRAAWADIRADLGRTPTRVWVPVGSATLATAFRAFLPPRLHLCCVDVGVLDPDDARLRALAALPGVTVLRVAQRFLEPCPVRVPVPSNAFYDAKVWPVLRERGADGDLWWNVAR